MGALGIHFCTRILTVSWGILQGCATPGRGFEPNSTDGEGLRIDRCSIPPGPLSSVKTALFITDPEKGRQKQLGLRVADNILDLVGNTPIVRLNRITKGVRSRVYAKLEFFNPGGSIKDRIGLAMVLDAERKGLIRPGCTIVEPTSGNTGMGLAFAAILRGYKVIFTVPDKMSRDKIDLLKAVGARVRVTPTRLPPGHPASYIEVAKKIARETPNSFMPNQYENASNPAAHYATTGPEIWSQTGGAVDVLVAGVGTGGTITGAGRFLKERKPSLRVVGVEPVGSILGARFRRQSATAHPYRVEGIGEDFVPKTLDMKVIDEFVTVTDRDALLMTRRLAREEGILAGSSSGAALVGALRVARRLDSSKTVVVILPDTGRSYLNKVYNDDWMAEHGFIPSPGKRVPVRSLLGSKLKRLPRVISVGPADNVSKALNLMAAHHVSHLPVIEGGVQVGSLSGELLLKALADAKGGRRVEQFMGPPLPTVEADAKIMLPGAIVTGTGAIAVVDGTKVVDVITTTDVINYLARR